MDKTLTDLSPLTEDKEVLTTVLAHLKSYQSQRSYLDAEWYRYEQYYRGKHFTTWNPNTKSTNEPPSRVGETRIPIPIAYDTVQRTLIEVCKDKPKFQVIPNSTEDKEAQRARWSNMLLDALFEKHRLGKKIKQVVLHGLKFSVGVMEVFWNPELEGGKGDVDFRVVPPEDFYTGLNFEEALDAPCVIKIIRRDLGYLINSDKYKARRKDWAKDIQPDNKVTDSAWRAMTLSRVYGDTGENATVPTPQGSVLCAEAYLKYYKDGVEPKWKLVTISLKQELILRTEEVDKPPFVIYHTDQTPGEFYGEGRLKHLIPLNKAIDLIENKNLAHHHKFIGGKYKMTTNADPSAVTNEAGQFIEYNTGSVFDVLPVPPIPPTTRDTVTAWHTYAQDTGGVHGASLGRTDKGIDSARGLESLQHGDQQAKSDLRDNLEDFLEEVGEETLRLISEHYKSTRLVTFYNDQGGLEQFKTVGESSPNKYKKELDAAIIKPRNDVKVTVGSRLGNTMDARQQKVLELYQMGLLPREEVLKEFAYGNISDLAQRALDQAQQMMEMKKDKPEQKQTRDFINTKYSDLAPNQQMAYSPQIGLPAPDDPSQVPGSVAAQLQLEHAKTAAKLDIQEHNSLLGQDASHGQMLGDLASQAAASVAPAIPGGAVDPTQGAPGELGIMPGQELTGENPNG